MSGSDTYGNPCVLVTRQSWPKHAFDTRWESCPAGVQKLYGEDVQESGAAEENGGTLSLHIAQGTVDLLQ